MPPAARARVPKRKAPRKRRDAETARAAILDAAERALVVAGPAGIRLQEVAAAAGVSHPNVLHHFGSREALVKAVITRALAAIHTRLLDGIAASTGEERQLAAMLDGVSDALTAGGHGRVLMWLALEGHRIDAVEVKLTDVVDATCALRSAKCREKGKRAPPREDTAYTVVLAALALLGAAVIGETMMENAGLAGDAMGSARFRAWLARVLVKHLDA